jgi:hypothetical protein
MTNEDDRLFLLLCAEFSFDELNRRQELSCADGMFRGYLKQEVDRFVNRILYDIKIVRLLAYDRLTTMVIPVEAMTRRVRLHDAHTN